MRNPRLAIVTVLVCLLGVPAARAVAAVPPAAEAAVACDRIVLRSRSGTEDGYRMLLGAVAVPGSGLLARGATREQGRHWRYFRHAGIAIRAGTATVRLTVPEGWRDRVAIAWGDSPASSSVRFAPCGRSPAGAWNAYSGGFHLRARGDCVPLLVTVGGMSTMVRVGVGRACGATS